MDCHWNIATFTYLCYFLLEQVKRTRTLSDNDPINIRIFYYFQMTMVLCLKRWANLTNHVKCSAKQKLKAWVFIWFHSTTCLQSSALIKKNPDMSQNKQLKWNTIQTSLTHFEECPCAPLLLETSTVFFHPAFLGQFNKSNQIVWSTW